MSGNHHRATPHDLGAVAAAVKKAVENAPRRRPRPISAKARKAMQPTKKQRADFEAKYAAAYVHVRYHIQPIGTMFEVWDTANHSIIATFPSFKWAREFVEAHS